MQGGAYESDTYLFHAGHDRDIVSDYATQDEQADTLRFAGAQAGDAVFDRDGWNLNIKAYGGEDQVTVKDYFYSDSYSRYNFAFDDASYDVAALRSRDLLKDGLPSVPLTEEKTAAQTADGVKAEAAPASSAGTIQTEGNAAAQTAADTAAPAQSGNVKAEAVSAGTKAATDGDAAPVKALTTQAASADLPQGATGMADGNAATPAAGGAQSTAAATDGDAAAPVKALTMQAASADSPQGATGTADGTATPAADGAQSTTAASDARAAAQAQHLIEAMTAFDTRSAAADNLAAPPLQQPPLAAADTATVKPLLP